MIFTYDWSVDFPTTRVPKTVTFPDGHKETIQYMRDGVILFLGNGLSATYTRIGDRSAEFEVIDSVEHLTNAHQEYMNKQNIGKELS